MLPAITLGIVYSPSLSCTLAHTNNAWIFGLLHLIIQCIAEANVIDLGKCISQNPIIIHGSLQLLFCLVYYQPVAGMLY